MIIVAVYVSITLKICLTARLIESVIMGIWGYGDINLALETEQKSHTIASVMC